MSTKIVSPRAELTVLRGMTSKDKRIAGSLISSVDESYFASDESKEIYNSIRGHMGKTGEVPPFRLVIEDPELSRNTRDYFKDSQATITSVEEAKKAVKILNRYRQQRGLYEIALAIDTALQSNQRIELDQLMDTVSGKMASVRTSKQVLDNFLHFGRNSNSRELVDQLLNGDPSEDTIPTGIGPFDEQSGGLMRGSLVTLGASSGGGKCCSLETRVQLSTLIICLEDGDYLEGEPEDLVFALEDGKIVTKRLDQICELDEIETDPTVVSQLLVARI